jgi:spermidine synthase
MLFVILTIGATGIIAQLVLIRELLVVFHGNELSLGLILGNWLIAEALGSYLYRRVKISQSAYALNILAFSTALPLLVILTRLIRPLVNILPWEIITIPLMYLLSLLILLPVGFLHGGLFTSSVSIIAQSQLNHNSKTPGFVYVVENVGTIIGGVILSFLLIPYVSSLKIAFIFGIIHLFAIFIIMKHRHFLLRYFSLVLMLLFAIGIRISSQIECWTLRRNFPDYNILSTANTIYSNITVINREEQYIFLVDRALAITVPYPNQHFIEDFVNFPLLQHPSPKKVLLIGGGAGGVINQMLEYDLDQIVYLERDPFLIQTIRKFPTPITEQELSDPRVNIINTDGRHYLENDTDHYDIILISFLDPLSLQTNRFFSQEFYRSCYDKLSNNGILATVCPGSITYVSPLLNNVIASHLKTLHQVFPTISMITGDFNLFLSYKDSSHTHLNPDTLSHRLLTRNIKTKLFSPGYMQYRLQQIYPASRNSAEIALINQDGIPRGLFYSLYYKNTITSPALKPLFNLIQKINFQLLLVLIILIFLILLVMRRKEQKATSVLFAVFSTGIAAMVFTLVLSLGFQIRYGYLYYQINILLTTFITGTVVGGVIGNRIGYVRKNIFILSEILILVLLVLIILSLQNSAYPKLFNTQIDFYIFLFIAGFFVGMQFPIANRILHTSAQTIASVVGKLYASDLLGGFVSAITVPIILIPILGIFNTLLLAVFLKIASLLLVLTLK